MQAGASRSKQSSVAVAIWLSRRPLQAGAGRILLFAVAGFGLCMIGFGLMLAAIALAFAVHVGIVTPP